MRDKARTKADEKWLNALGSHLEKLIKQEGYKSVYDFWIHKAGDDISRATLNFIVAGKSNPKATTLKTLAHLLEVKPSEILDF